LSAIAKNDWVYLNGEFVRRDAARISPFDRGFLFAHAAYEVTAIYGGKLIDFGAHLERLGRTLSGIEILPPDIDIEALHHEMMHRNDVTEGLIYIQVSAGDQGPRDFYGPEEIVPSVFMFSTEKRLISDAARDGIVVISVADERWVRRDLKTTQLLSQSLAYRAARRAGALTAIMHEDGVVTEAASANAWIVTADGVLVTRNLSSALLPGITRGTLARLLRDVGLSVEERAFTLDEIRGAVEAFTSSTGLVIAPILAMDGEAIGGGKVGPVTRLVQATYYAYLGADLTQIDWL
jgi:D-alanine transaminase